MRILIFALLLISPELINAQKRATTPKDSIQYYQKQLQTLWKDTYDSLRNSEKYTEVLNSLQRLKKNSDNYTGPIFYTDIVHSDYTNFNNSIVQSGFTALKPNLFRLGFGIGIKRNRTIADFNIAIGGFNNISKKADEKIKTSLSSFLQIDIGYDLTKSKIIDIYPFAGIGLRASNLNYFAPATTNPNYTNISNIVLNNQTTYSSSFTLGYQAGLGIDLKLSTSKNEESSTIFFTKFGINRPFGIEKYDVEGITYKPGITQGIWVLAFGFKFASK